MPKKKPTSRRQPPDDKAQSRAFIEKAREIGAEDESGADTLMGRLANMPPKPHSRTKRKSGKG